MRALTLLVAATTVEAFNLAAPATLRPAVASPVRSSLTMQFGGKKKTVEEVLEEKGYWAGEWVCADCGFIYEPGTAPPFEELRPRWKCPQCAGPRRRFVKKAGSMVGSVDDSALINGTIGAAILVITLVFVGLSI